MSMTAGPARVGAAAYGGAMGDFDFYVGTWDIANRRRVDYLDEASPWEEFPAVSVAARHFDGAANIDEITFPTKGWAGLTVRLYDPATSLWSLYWISRSAPVITTPVTGRFVNGRGEFVNDEAWDGVPVRVRFLWTDISDTTARWEQAFSRDGGSTWLPNWVMESTRR